MITIPQDAVFAIFDDRTVPTGNTKPLPILAGGRYNGIMTVITAAETLLGVPNHVSFITSHTEKCTIMHWEGYGQLLFTTNDHLIAAFDASAFINHRHSLTITEE